MQKTGLVRVDEDGKCSENQGNASYDVLCVRGMADPS